MPPGCTTSCPGTSPATWFRRDDRADAFVIVVNAGSKLESLAASSPRPARAGKLNFGSAAWERHPRRERALQCERARESHAHSLQGHERCERGAPGGQIDLIIAASRRRSGDQGASEGLAVSMARRSPALPGVPTAVEQASITRHQLVRVRVPQGTRRSHRQPARGRRQGAGGSRPSGKSSPRKSGAV